MSTAGRALAASSDAVVDGLAVDGLEDQTGVGTLDQPVGANDVADWH
jgi:hypothetical protein